MSYLVTNPSGVRTEYEGIRQYRVPCTLSSNEVIVIVENEGDPDIWIIDRRSGMDELARLYRDTFEHNFVGKPQTRFVTIVRSK